MSIGREYKTPIEFLDQPKFTTTIHYINIKDDVVRAEYHIMTLLIDGNTLAKQIEEKKFQCADILRQNEKGDTVIHRFFQNPIYDFDKEWLQQEEKLAALDKQHKRMLLYPSPHMTSHTNIEPGTLGDTPYLETTNRKDLPLPAIVKNLTCNQTEYLSSVKNEWNFTILTALLKPFCDNEKEHQKEIEKLLTVKNKEGRTILHEYFYAEYAHLANTLIVDLPSKLNDEAKKSLINTTDNQGENYFFQAIRIWDVTTLECIIGPFGNELSKIVIRSRNHKGETLFHSLFQPKKYPHDFDQEFSKLKVLISTNNNYKSSAALLMSPDKQGQYPLHLAFQVEKYSNENKSKIFKYIIEILLMADVYDKALTLTDKKGHTLSDYAKKWCDTSSNSGEFKTPFQFLDQPRLQTKHFLLGSDINGNILAKLIENQNFTIADMLHQDKNGDTALHYFFRYAPYYASTAGDSLEWHKLILLALLKPFNDAINISQKSEERNQTSKKINPEQKEGNQTAEKIGLLSLFTAKNNEGRTILHELRHNPILAERRTRLHELRHNLIIAESSFILLSGIINIPNKAQKQYILNDTDKKGETLFFPIIRHYELSALANTITAFGKEVSKNAFAIKNNNNETLFHTLFSTNKTFKHVFDSLELLINTNNDCTFSADLLMTCDRQGRCPLHLILQKNKFNEVEQQALFAYLKEILCKANKYQEALNITDQSGHMPLHYACQSGDTTLVKMLLDDTDLATKLDKTHLATKAIPATISERNKTALHLACQHGNLEMVDIITDATGPFYFNQAVTSDDLVLNIVAKQKKFSIIQFDKIVKQKCTLIRIYEYLVNQEKVILAASFFSNKEDFENRKKDFINALKEIKETRPPSLNNMDQFKAKEYGPFKGSSRYANLRKELLIIPPKDFKAFNNYLKQQDSALAKSILRALTNDNPDSTATASAAVTGSQPAPSAPPDFTLTQSFEQTASATQHEAKSLFIAHKKTLTVTKDNASQPTPPTSQNATPTYQPAYPRASGH